MSEWSVPVDLRNPGQVFACRGFVEAAETLLGRAFASSFHYEPLATRGRFVICGEAQDHPIEAVIRFLQRAEASIVVPSPQPVPALSAETWKTPSTMASDSHAFPMRVPQKPASLPALISDGVTDLQIDAWCDGPKQLGRDNVKFWAGSGGYPGAALARDALVPIAKMTSEEALGAIADPFAFAAPMTSSFGFDWRRSYIPLDAGFSPNEHKKKMTMLGFPLTELLAVIGLQNARPQIFDKLSYRYGISAARLPTILARPILGGTEIGFPMRTFRLQLARPGKASKMRCIINAQEELHS